MYVHSMIDTPYYCPVPTYVTVKPGARQPSRINLEPPILCNTYTYAAWRSVTFTLLPLGLT